MKNYEKYADAVKEFEGASFCDDFVIPHIIKSKERCNSTRCTACRMLQMIWLLEEYEEPEPDWSKVEVDTPILVKSYEDFVWNKRHFAKYENGDVYAWSSGRTSWSQERDMVRWKYAKLAEKEESDE